MTAAILIKVLHIFSAMWLAAGILGRELARSQARQANALPDFRTLAGLAGKFEGLMSNRAVLQSFSVGSSWLSSRVGRFSGSSRVPRLIGC
jgi:hypothetical protein